LVFVIETVSVYCEVETERVDIFVGEIQASNREFFACDGEGEETRKRETKARKK
jgi:hypothetical protein